MEEYLCGSGREHPAPVSSLQDFNPEIFGVLNYNMPPYGVYSNQHALCHLPLQIWLHDAEHPSYSAMGITGLPVC